jgi:hypothetical protein
MGPHMLRGTLINISEMPELGLSEAEKSSMVNHRLKGTRGRYVNPVDTTRAFNLCGEVIERWLDPLHAAPANVEILMSHLQERHAAEHQQQTEEKKSTVV